MQAPPCPLLTPCATPLRPSPTCCALPCPSHPPHQHPNQPPSGTGPPLVMQLLEYVEREFLKVKRKQAQLLGMKEDTKAAAEAVHSKL